MKNIFFPLAAVFILTTVVVAQRSNCPVAPFVNTITQPNGSSITLHPYGNEAVHYLETSEGYTVLQNKDGNFEYAVLGIDGNLTNSGIIASDNNNISVKTDLQQHLRYNAQQVSALVQYHQSLEGNQGFGKTGANVFPPTGTHKVMVLLIQYPDLLASVPLTNFQLMFNQPNWGNTGSFHDYYLKTSYGRLNLTVDVYGWYKATNGYLYYKSNSTALLQRAVFCADSAGVDFSQYDGDNDGYLDAVMVLHSGIGAEEQSAPNANNYIWSFRSTWNGSPTYNHGKRVWAYDMFPETRFSTGSMIGIGVMTHEFGHILDLPDLYSTQYTNEGVGDYANMSGGPWLNSEHSPCLHDAWSRMQLGWLNPTVINTPGTYTTAKFVADSNFAFRINTLKPNEYFLIEARQPKGFDRYLPSKGLAIWHINSSMAGKLSQLGNNANNDTSNMGVAILQADGKQDLEKNANRGDAGDLYPGSTNNHNATPYSKPNTSLCAKVSGVRQSSGIYITNITVNTDSSVTFKFGALPNASFSPSTNGACTQAPIIFVNNSVFAKTYQWDFGDGTTSVNVNDTHAYANAGNYNVWLRVYDSTGVIADSTTQIIQVYTTPVASFTYSRKGNFLFFKNTSTNALNYKWTFGGYTALQTVPQDSLNLKDIQTNGIINFTLIAFGNGGCTDTTQTNIDIWYLGSGSVNAHSFAAKLAPNPIGENAVLTFTSQTENVSVEFYNMLGERISVLENTAMAAGTHEVEISRTQFPAKGIYLIRISSSTHSEYLRLLNQ
ncbi:MAG: M6 family metalloprotease domain-containing protein [Bacteroidia bacterium]